MRKLLILLFLLNTTKIFAAGCAGTGNCFWVCQLAGGNTNTTTCWATLSGGVVTGGVPTATDNCVFDAGIAGTGTATVNAALACNSLTTVGFAGTVAGSSAITIAGDWASGVGTTWNYTGISTFTATSGSHTITSNGNAGYKHTFIIGSSASTANWTLADTFVATGTAGQIIISQGNFSFNGKNYTATFLDTNNSTTRSITFANETVYVKGNDTSTNTFKFGTTNGLTISGATSGSTIKLDEHSSTSTFAMTIGWANQPFFPNLYVTGTGSVTHRFNTGTESTTGGFEDFKVDALPHTITWAAGRKCSFKTLHLSGTAGNLVTLNTNSAGTPWYMQARAGSGVWSLDYMSIKDTVCEGTCCLAGSHSTNVSGNLGWIFVTNSPVCPTGSEFGGGI